MRVVRVLIVRVEDFDFDNILLDKKSFENSY